MFNIFHTCNFKLVDVKSFKTDDGSGGVFRYYRCKCGKTYNEMSIYKNINGEIYGESN